MPIAEAPNVEVLLLRAVAEACNVPPPRDVVEWAETERVVSPESGSPWPGRWRTDRVPYLREVMRVLSLSHPARRVTFVKAAQVGGSEAILNLIGQIIAERPTSVLVMLPSIDMVRGYNRLKLDPMVSATPALRSRVRDQVEGDDEASTVTFKKFPGGYLQLLTAASSANLQMRSARVLVCEEVSDYPLDTGGRGDPVAQLEARATAYAGREKIIKISTPAEEGSCRVTEEYQRSSKGRYFVPCPHCGERQPLEWESLRWPKGVPQDVRYHCVGCGAGIEHSHKASMLAAGEWVHERPELVDVHAGYSLSGLYSPTLSWSDLAEAWERCQNDQGQIKTFVQQKLGRAWRVSGEAPDWQRLYDRREHWPVGVVPMGGLLLTAGVDVQRDRLEVSVWAWGRDRQSWLVDHRLLAGNPFESAVWEELRLLVNEAWRHESGRWMPVALTAIDSGDGVTTGEVYNFVRRLGVGRAIAVKGQDGLRVALGNPTPTEVTRKGKKLRGLKVWPVGSSFIKSETYGWLRLDRPTEESGQSYPAGFIHLPVHTAGEEFCKQLTAEHLVVKNAKNGYRRLEWVKTRDRNEALDCRVYARAAAVLLGVDRWSERRWDKISASLSVPVPGVAAIVESEQGDREDEGAESVVESGPSSSDGARSGPVVRPRSWGAGLGASW